MVSNCGGRAGIGVLKSILGGVAALPRAGKLFPKVYKASPPHGFSSALLFHGSSRCPLEAGPALQPAPAASSEARTAGAGTQFARSPGLGCRPCGPRPARDRLRPTLGATLGGPPPECGSHPAPGGPGYGIWENCGAGPPPAWTRGEATTLTIRRAPEKGAPGGWCQRPGGAPSRAPSDRTLRTPAPPVTPRPVSPSPG